MAPRAGPNLFLIIKEPPLPASYDKAVYIQRILDELAPQHTDVKCQFMVRALPTSATELNQLISRLARAAAFDSTIISTTLLDP